MSGYSGVVSLYKKYSKKLKKKIEIDELYYGGRRRNVSFARAQAAHILIDNFGITLAEVARNLGVTTSAIFNMLKRKYDKFH